MTNEVATKVIINCSTGERSVVPLTEEEIAERELMAQQAEADRLQAEQEAAELAALKQSAQDKLKALGLSDLEVAALTGA